MQLTLTIIAPRPGPGQVPVKTFMLCGGHVGRGAENDWVLADTANRLSKTHFTIDFDGRGYWLTDVSTNGVFLNHSLERLPRGQRVQVNHGDHLRCADYEIEASLEDARMDDSFLAVLTGDKSTTPEPAEPDPLNATFYTPPKVEKPAPPLPDLDDDPLADFAPPPSGPAADPLAEFNLSPPEAPGDPLAGFISSGPMNFNRDPLPPRPAEPDHVPAAQQFFRPPQTSYQIPDDWLADPADGKTDEPDRTLMQSAPTHEPAPAPPAASADGDALLAAFLAGAGLDERSLAGLPPEQVMRQAGQVFRMLVDGVRIELAGRAAVKNEFRLERTFLQAQNNNPLKFSASPNDAARALLRPTERGSMPAEQAVREAFQDLQHHQVAMLAGMQEAIVGLLHRFSPDEVEKRIGRASGLLGILAGSGKTRYWDAFRQLYDTIAAEVADDFHQALGKDFGKAYSRNKDS